MHYIRCLHIHADTQGHHGEEKSTENILGCTYLVRLSDCDVKTYLAASVALCPSPVMNEKMLGVLQFFANFIIKEKQ